MAQPEATSRLLERARAGDRDAVDVLFARYLVPLTRFAAGRLPGWARRLTDTHDLVQDVLVQTFKNLGRFEARGEGALTAYLRQALMNRLRDEIRRVKRLPDETTLDSRNEDDAPSPLEAAVGREALDRYERALLSLGDHEREAVIARLEFGYTFPEIADMLGKPSPDAARMMVERAILRLVQEIGRER